MPSIYSRRERGFFQGPDGEQYDKFSTKNKPTKSMFRKLFESVGFLTEKDDTAQTDVQGFVQLNTDDEASSKDSTVSANGFAKVIQAHHLPHIIEDSNPDNPDTLGDPNNRLSVRKITGNYGRTGGDGDTYIIKNTMAVTKNPALGFVTIAQSNPGTDVSLGFNANAFDSAVGSTPTLISVIGTLNVAAHKAARGLLGELKMYANFYVGVGTATSEFDGNGVGRDVSTGKSGDWVGWVLLMGQSASMLASFPYNADSGLLSRITIGNNIVDTRSRYPMGINPSIPGENAGFSVLGKNTHTLSEDETPLKTHKHSLIGLSATTEPAGNHSHQFEIHNISGLDLRTAGGFFWGGGHFETTSTAIPPDHTHPVNITGDISTESGTGIAHNNRPESFVVCYAMYLGTQGATT